MDLEGTSEYGLSLYLRDGSVEPDKEGGVEAGAERGPPLLVDDPDQHVDGHPGDEHLGRRQPQDVPPLGPVQSLEPDLARQQLPCRA